MAKKPSYTYGQQPPPSNWHQTASILKDIHDNGKKPKSGLMDRLATIEEMLKAKK